MQTSPAITTKCVDCAIRHRAVCSRCGGDELARLEEIKYYRRYNSGETITIAGETMDFVGSIISGVATLTQTMEDGRTQMGGRAHADGGPAPAERFRWASGPKLRRL